MSYLTEEHRKGFDNYKVPSDTSVHSNIIINIHFD